MCIGKFHMEDDNVIFFLFNINNVRNGHGVVPVCLLTFVWMHVWVCVHGLCLWKCVAVWIYICLCTDKCICIHVHSVCVCVCVCPAYSIAIRRNILSCNHCITIHVLLADSCQCIGLMCLCACRHRMMWAPWCRPPAGKWTRRTGLPRQSHGSEGQGPQPPVPRSWPWARAWQLRWPPLWPGSSVLPEDEREEEKKKTCLTSVTCCGNTNKAVA